MHSAKPTPRYDINRNHKAIGEYSEAVIKAKLIEIGYGVYNPFGDNLRCDLLIEDINGEFWRIQCKTGWTKPGGVYIHFLTASSYAHTKAGQAGERLRDYQGQIDYFAVYCPQTRGIYLIPIDHISGTHALLCLTQTANSHTEKVKLARDYEL